MSERPRCEQRPQRRRLAAVADPGCGYVEISEIAEDLATQAVGQGHGLSGPMDTEHYASHLAALWESARPVLGPEKASALGCEVVERLGASGDPVAAVILRGLAAVGERPPGALAARLASRPAPEGVELPGWIDSVGEAIAVGAGRVEDPTSDDGTIVMMDLRWPSGDGAGVGVFIDANGYAKHILVGPSIEECVDEIEDHERQRWPLETLDRRHAADLMAAAVEVTEASPDARVGETYGSQRAFLRCQLRRLTAVPRDRRAA
ncbi:MAG: hypothetical protein ACJ75R_03895 [Solirubrobacterales bacterium]